MVHNFKLRAGMLAQTPANISNIEISEMLRELGARGSHGWPCSPFIAYMKHVAVFVSVANGESNGGRRHKKKGSRQMCNKRRLQPQARVNLRAMSEMRSHLPCFCEVPRSRDNHP